MEVEVVETGRFAVHTDLKIARDRRNLIVRGFAALHPPDDFEFTIRSRHPALRRARDERGGDRRRASSRRTRSSSSAPTCSPRRRAWKAIRTTSRRRCWAASCCAPTGTRSASTRRAGLECLLVVPARPSARPRRARRSRRGSRSRTPSSTSPTPRCSCSASPAVTSASSPRSRRPHPPTAPRAPLSALVGARADAKGLGALGATISGAGPTVLVWCDVASTGAVRGAWSGSPRGGRRSAACRSRPRAPTSARCDRPAARVHGLAAHVGPGAALPGRRRARARRSPDTSAGRRCRAISTWRPTSRACWTRRASSAPTSSATRSAATSRCCWPRAAGRTTVVALAPAGGAEHARRSTGRSGASRLSDFTTRSCRRTCSSTSGPPCARCDKAPLIANAAAHGWPLDTTKVRCPVRILWGSRTSCCRGRMRRRATGARSTRSGSSSTASGTRHNSTSRSRRLS